MQPGASKEKQEGGDENNEQAAECEKEAIRKEETIFD